MRCRSIHLGPSGAVRVSLLAAALVLAGATSVGAADSEDARQARMCYRRGEEAFRAGRFQQAYQEWEAGYRLSNRPLFLLNMAHAQRRRGELGSARALYRRFLLIEPASKLREEIEAVLAEIEDTLAAQPSGLEHGDGSREGGAPPDGTRPVAATEAAAGPPSAGGGAARDPLHATMPPPMDPMAPAASTASAATMVTDPSLGLPAFGRVAGPEAAGPGTPSPQSSITDSAPPAARPPIYKRWWFWSGVGALVTGGLGAVFLLRSTPYARNGSLGTIGAPP